MKVEKWELGSFRTNCYIVIGDNNEAMVIDPGYQDEKLLDYLKQYRVKYIVNTHGHIDHIGGNFDTKERTGAPLCIHKADESYLGKDPNSYIHFNKNFKKSTADKYLKEGDVLTFGGLEAKILETPGHTKGGISIVIGDYVFSGDTLFRNSIGRTDLADGNFNQLIDSITKKLMTLPGDTIVCPGHMGESTIEHEKNHNPFL